MMGGRWLAPALASLLLAPSPKAGAVDQDDIYTYGYVGRRFEGQFQGGVGFGFAPVDQIGIGLFGDLTTTLAQGGIEARWFLEPFEVSAAAGFARVDDGAASAKVFPTFVIGAAYLIALTPNLALRVEVRGQYLVKSTSSVLAGLGARMVF